jgi:16S rRNA processing protein RimM
MLGKKWVLVGSVGKPYGLKGGLKVNSYTEPFSNILAYQPWYLGNVSEVAETLSPVVLVHHQIHDQRVIVQFEGYNSPESAQALTNQCIYVSREQLPSLDNQTYYWTDLIGLSVYDLAGEYLGTIKTLLETGANDVLVVENEQDKKRRLIPFLLEKTIKQVDTVHAKLIVDWDPHF